VRTIANMGLITFRLIDRAGTPRGARPRAGKRAAYGVVVILSTAMGRFLAMRPGRHGSKSRDVDPVSSRRSAGIRHLSAPL